MNDDLIRELISSIDAVFRELPSPGEFQEQLGSIAHSLRGLASAIEANTSAVEANTSAVNYLESTIRSTRH